MKKNLNKICTGTIITSALILTSITSAHATTFTSGHTDIVSVSCNSIGVLTINTYREDIGHINPNNIGDHILSYNLSKSNGGLSYKSNLWTASGDGTYEDDIPFIGFQYAKADSDLLCPESVSFDVSKVTDAANTGNATFTANNPIVGNTSSTPNDTNKVTLWKPGTNDKPSHAHGTWTFEGPASGANYTLKFDTYRENSTTSMSTISPVRIQVQP